MKKKIEDNFRVVCFVKSKREAEVIIEQIVRHVDVVRRSVFIESDVKYTCSFCGLDWQEYSSQDSREDPLIVVGAPSCCSAAEEEWLVENGYAPADYGYTAK